MKTPQWLLWSNCSASFRPDVIRLVECKKRARKPTAKSATWRNLTPQARYDYLLVNDSDITVESHYLQRVMAHFAPPAQMHAVGKGAKHVGLVTALYRGRAHATLASRFEALGIATDFQAGVLLSRDAGRRAQLRLGSTLASEA